MLRGALIVIEGCDRSGKTTVCKNIVSTLRKSGIMAEYMNFPDRSTQIGQQIDSYLGSKVELSNEVIHLLFSANRWEKERLIRDKLREGVTLVIDRYAFSGVAFSSAKGMGLEWCKGPDRMLPRPDRVFLLTLSMEALRARKGFGEERYEQSAFQQKVMECYQHLKDETWEEIDADKTQEELHDDLVVRVKHTLENITKDVGYLWGDDRCPIIQ